MRRAGLSPTDRAQVQRAFRILYRSQLNVSQALDRMRQEFTGGPALEIVNFVAGSRRGICPMRDGHGDHDAVSDV
jgi:UDP-N-acetylglucosamine acyltransferase